MLGVSKWLMMGAVFISIPLSAAAVEAFDGCESGLIADRYYGAFVRGLALGALSDAQIEKAIASETPVNPLASERPSVANINIKSALSAMIQDPQVRAAWPKTRERLRALGAERQGRDRVRVDARATTARVLSPRNLFELETIWPSVAGTTLPDGRAALLHFIGRDKFAVTRLDDGSAILPPQRLPEEVAYAEEAHLSWHHDEDGKLWMYLVFTARSRGNFVYRRQWGADAWERLELAIPADVKALCMLDVAPGFLLLRVEGPEGPHVLNLAGAHAVEIPGMSDLKPGTFALQASGVLSVEGGARSYMHVFSTRHGLVRFSVGFSSFETEWRGNTYEAKLTSSFHLHQALTFRECRNGDEFVAWAYEEGGSPKIGIWRMDAFDSPLWTIPMNELEVRAMFLFENDAGQPFLAVETEETKNKNALHIFDLTHRALVMRMALPGYIEDWMTIGGEPHFTVYSSRDQHMLFTPFADSRKN